MTRVIVTKEWPGENEMEIKVGALTWEEPLDVYLGGAAAVLIGLATNLQREEDRTITADIWVPTSSRIKYGIDYGVDSNWTFLSYVSDLCFEETGDAEKPHRVCSGAVRTIHAVPNAGFPKGVLNG